MEPKPTLYGILVQKAQYNEFCRVWAKELSLDELSSDLHEIKEHTDKNKSYYDEMTSGPRRLRILFMNTDHYIRVLCMLQYSPLCFLCLPYGGLYTLYRLFLIIWTLHLLII